MKVLILSVDPWCQNNSFGNTYSNIFGKIENVEIAHIYMLDGLPDQENNVSRYYQISEKDILKSALRPFSCERGVGCEVYASDKNKQNNAISHNRDTRKSAYDKLLGFGKKHHWKSMFIAREVAWKIGKVNYESLFTFIEDFQPDIFVLAYYYVYNSNRIAFRIKQHFDIPMVMIMMMDHYSLNRVSWSPFFWLDRFAKRTRIRDLVKESEKMFVISKKLKDELERELRIPCQVLYKIPDENRSFYPYLSSEGTVKYLFTGNIYANRWKSLAMLVSVLKKQGGGKLDIYTSTHISKTMDAALNISGVSEVHESVTQDEVIRLQNQSDVMVHVEAFDKKNKSLVRCAISTKIMDYLSVGRCILAIGPSDIASMEYLTDNDLALYAYNERQLGEIVKKINTDHALLESYAAKVRAYATKKLDATQLRKEVYDSFQQVIEHYKHN